MSPRALMIAAALGSLALLAGAYLFQALGYAPCKMCLWQRWPHGLAIGAGALAFVWPHWPVAVLGALSAFTTSAIGLFHTGVEKGWWPGPSSCSGGGDLSGLSGSDLLSTDVPDKVVMCDQVSWALLGVSMASWNAILSLGLALLWVTAAVKTMRG